MENISKKYSIEEFKQIRRQMERKLKRLAAARDVISEEINDLKDALNIKDIVLPRSENIILESPPEWEDAIKQCMEKQAASANGSFSG